MVRTLKSSRLGMGLFEDKLGAVRKKLAKAMVGSTVDLLADGHTIAHGIVTGVFLKSGTPKIIVNGQTYDIDQVVTYTAASIAQLQLT
jgi:hypothetical protein